MNISDIPFLIRDIQREMPFHTNNKVVIPSTYKNLPEQPMEESHKVDNKFLNNHLGEIEEAVDKKLLNKIPFIQQQKKYHEKSGILNHDNFFHCDLATGTPISNDNFRHSQFMINSYTEAGACTPGDDLETFGAVGGYGNTSAQYFVLMRTPGTDGVIGECYDQVTIDSNNTTGNIRMGAYDDNSNDPNVMYAQTGSVSQMDDYSWVAITEFELTSVRTWLAFQKDQDSSMREGEATAYERWHKTYTYGAFPEPAGTGYIECTTSVCAINRMKIGHTGS